MSTLLEDEFTLFPMGDEEREVFPEFDGSRVVVRFDSDLVLTDDWVERIERSTGRYVEVRRADCGAGCRCAGEVRLK